MKILYITHYFLPKHIAGIEISTYNIAYYINNNTDNEAVVLTRETGHHLRKYYLQKEIYNNIPVYRMYINKKLDFKDSYNNEYLNYKFKNILKDIKPDIIHIHHLEGLSAGFIDTAKKLSIPIVLTLHDYWFLCPSIKLLKDKNILCRNNDSGSDCHSCGNGYPTNMFTDYSLIVRSLRFIKNIFNIKIRSKKPIKKRKPEITEDMTKTRFNYLKEQFNKADYIISPSNFLIDIFRQFGFPADKIHYSDNGYRKYKRFVKKESKFLRFGFIGTLSEHKGTDILIKAFTEVHNKNIRLNIFGRGTASFEEYLKKISEGDKRIKFYGAFRHNEQDKIFSNIDVLVVPSIWYENSPLVIHEAQIFKTSVIGSDIGGIKEFIKEGKNGLLFETGSKDGLKQVIETLANDKDILKNLNNYFTVKTIEELTDELIFKYNNLINSFPK